MECPHCRDDAEPMTRQDDLIADGLLKPLRPGALYVCHACGREYRWERGRPGLRKLFLDEDFEPPQPAWRESP